MYCLQEVPLTHATGALVQQGPSLVVSHEGMEGPVCGMELLLTALGGMVCGVCVVCVLGVCRDGLYVMHVVYVDVQQI